MDLRRNMKHTVLVYMSCHYTRTLKCVHLVGNFFNEMYLCAEKYGEPGTSSCTSVFDRLFSHIFNRYLLLLGESTLCTYNWEYLVRVQSGGILCMYRQESCAGTDGSILCLYVQVGVHILCKYSWE
jgi:hypothetical protein